MNCKSHCSQLPRNQGHRDNRKGVQITGIISGFDMRDGCGIIGINETHGIIGTLGACGSIGMIALPWIDIMEHYLSRNLRDLRDAEELGSGQI